MSKTWFVWYHWRKGRGVLVYSKLPGNLSTQNLFLPEDRYSYFWNENINRNNFYLNVQRNNIFLKLPEKKFIDFFFFFCVPWMSTDCFPFLYTEGHLIKQWKAMVSKLCYRCTRWINSINGNETPIYFLKFNSWLKHFCQFSIVFKFFPCFHMTVVRKLETI